ncbi:MAG: hypothetical protein JXR88_09400 [Clostridia bacterium]|nr:hypothetical protein [Clostridia bacterium]
MLHRKKVLVFIFVVLAFMTFGFAETTFKKISDVEAYETFQVIEHPENIEKLYENNNFIFEYRDERDVLFITDKTNHYTWKTGLDIPTAKEVKKALREEEPLGYEPLEEKLNETFTAIANSLIVVEYYDDSLGIKRLPSVDGNSMLKGVLGEENHFVLEMNYEEIDLQVKAHLIFTDQGYDLEIYENEITGSDKPVVASIMLNPFLGASGGAYALYDPETGKHGDAVKKPEIPGYVLVPDGPGALIEFNDYNESLKPYQAKVYGENLSKSTYNYNLAEIYYVPFKNPTMPLYGIAHTKSDAAFIGFATKGDYHMEVVVMPEENTTLYTWAYPRFVKNSVYYQVFNKRGEGYFTLMDEPEAYDIAFSYVFIHESDDLKADYTGMALTYRDYLKSTGQLERRDNLDALPIRLDFIMSDIKKSVLNFVDGVVTKALDVESLLNQLSSQGIENINSGLMGWQEGGITAGKPWESNWSRAIGTKGEFKSLVSSNYDISFDQDYLKFNAEQASEVNKAIKHINNWYVTLTEVDDEPITEFNFAKPSVSVDWLKRQLKDLKDLDLKSHTIEGISSHLFTEHGKTVMEEEDVVSLYQETLSNLEMKLNLKTPNQYFWPYTDRYLQAPVYPTQYLIETKTVPFLSMVLNQSMEVYAPYSNFSFSGDKDILKMIDYNLYPSFVLTKEPSYLLSSTNALDFYSTEFTQYEHLIKKVYEEVSSALEPVLNAYWLKREEVLPNVIKNTYDNGVMIYINYNEETVIYDNLKVPGVSYVVVE